MRGAVFLAIVAVVLAKADYAIQFSSWATQFNITYSSDAQRDIRLEIFKDNMDKINKHNSGHHTWTMAVNQFADMTQHEFAAKMLGYKPPTTDNMVNVHDIMPGEVLAGEVNWVTKGAVSAVKNQGQCGSCWAFSTCAAVEGAYKLHGGALTNLAPQQLVDCDKTDSGCNGGLMDNGFKYIQSNGICSMTEYPYTGRAGTCRASSCKSVTKVSSYSNVARSESALASAVNSRPVSVACDAEPWQFYHSGIFSQSCGTTLDHGILAAGYDTSAGYWLVKNSWGTSWGESGYIRLKYGSNECGIANGASYPVI